MHLTHCAMCSMDLGFVLCPLFTVYLRMLPVVFYAFIFAHYAFDFAFLFHNLLSLWVGELQIGFGDVKCLLSFVFYTSFKKIVVKVMN